MHGGGRTREDSRLSRALRVVVLATVLVLSVVALTTTPTQDSPKVRVTGATVLGAFDTGEMPTAGWTLAPSAATGQLRASTADAHDGPGALEVTGPAAGTTLALSKSVGTIRPGERYVVSATVRPREGSQQLRLTFTDASGGSSATVSATTPTTNSWTRVAVSGQAPASARGALVSIVAPPSTSAEWDSVLGLRPTPGDAGFEAAGDLREHWTVDATGGATVQSSTDAHSGAASAELRAPSGRQAGLRSHPVPVFPGVAQRLSAWVRVTEGGVALTTEWYAADGTVVLSSRAPADATAGWSRLSTDVTAPDGAQAVSVGVSTIPDSPTHAWVDDVTLEPAASRPPVAGTPRTLARLGGFVTTTTSQIATVGGRPQLMTVVSGEEATFQVFDLETGRRLSSHPMGAGPNGWALTKGTTDRDAYVGSGDGHLWHYDTGTGAFTDLGRATPEAKLVWSLATDTAGVVWGASYPGGQLWTWDPSKRSFTTWGRVSPDSEYARGLAVDDDAVYVGTGSVRPHILVVPRDGRPTRRIEPPTPMAHGSVKELQRNGRYLLARFTSGITGAYDLGASRWVTPPGPPVVTAGSMPSSAPPGAPFYVIDRGHIWKLDGSASDPASPVAIATTGMAPARDTAVVPTTIRGHRGAWLVAFDGVDRVQAVNLSDVRYVPGRPLPPAGVVTSRLDVAPSALRIKSLVADGDVVHVGGFGGPSFATVDAAGRTVFRYPRGDETSDPDIGEIEGMAVNGADVYLGSYTGARILRYDPRQPWATGHNPVQIGSLGPSYQQDRPQAWAVDGPRTYFGTIPTYGVRGGALGWVDGSDGSVVAVRSPAKEQSVSSIAGRGGVAFVGTSRWGGLGVAPDASPVAVYAYDTARRRTLWTTPLGADVQSVGSLVVTAKGELYGLADGTVVQLDPETGARLRAFALATTPAPAVPTWSNSQLLEVDGTLYAALRGGVYAIDTRSWSVTAVARSGASPSKLTTNGSTLFYPSGTKLMSASLRGPEEAAPTDD